jgi:uncharacterized protein (TIGR00299 family) protein
MWVDATAGAGADLLLGALLGAGVPLGVVADAVDKIAPGRVVVAEEQVTRAGFVATRCRVEVEDAAPDLGWGEVELLLAGAGLHEDVRSLAHDVLARLAEAESSVRGVPLDAVRLSGLGSLTDVTQVVGVCAAVVHLDLRWVVVSPVSVGGGVAVPAAAERPVPSPVVLELLRGVPSAGGPVGLEACTPTGAALLTGLADDWGVQPTMTVLGVGAGAGAADGERRPVLRVLVGESAPESLAQASSAGSGAHGAWVLESNVDDLDLRAWPEVLAALLEAGANEAWLTPVVGAHGRPAHVLSVLVAGDHADVVRREIHLQTFTTCLREFPVATRELDHERSMVEVGGHVVAVRVTRFEGKVLVVRPEFEDVAAVAHALRRPVGSVMVEAAALARELA